MNSSNKERKEKNRREEAIHIEYFKECCKDLPIIIHEEHSDNPDFLIKHNEGVLGIEHTKLFKVTKHPNAPQALESFRKKIVDSAKKQCEKDIPPLWVEIWFDFNQKVPKNRTQEIKRISQSLAEMVKKWHKEKPSKPDEFIKLPSQIPDIFQMNITRRVWNEKTGQPDHLWTVEGLAWVQNLTIDKIQNRIDEKNRRYEEYLKKCDECWLLIVFNLFKNSQSFKMPNQRNHRFESKFERVFFMDASHRKELLKLPVIRI